MLNADDSPQYIIVRTAASWTAAMKRPDIMGLSCLFDCIWSSAAIGSSNVHSMLASPRPRQGQTRQADNGVKASLACPSQAGSTVRVLLEIF